MKTRPRHLFTRLGEASCIAWVALALFADIHQAAAQGTRFFRIAGPTATTITTLRPDGTMVWSNAQSGSNYTVQTVSALPGKTNWVNYVQISASNSVNTNLLVAFHPPAGMALIPAGSFTIGNSIGDSDIIDANSTNVAVSGFYMDTNPVGSNQWRTVYNWATTNGYVFDNAGLGKAANHPVQTVNWYDAVKWCNARSQQAGLTPVYFADANLTQVYTNGDTAPYANWTNNGYRLPTEAEWEKAARGGLNGQRFPRGNIISESVANYYGYTGSGYDLGPNGYNTNFNTLGSPFTSPAGYFAMNGYGLFDMTGNVEEWCWDWYAAQPYPAGSPYLGGADPRGPASGSYRILRGGYWANYASYARCANRSNYSPTSAVNYVGFRCVRGL